MVRSPFTRFRRASRDPAAHHTPTGPVLSHGAACGGVKRSDVQPEQCNLAFSSFSFRVNGGVPAVFRLSLQKDSLCAPAGESAVFCCTDGAVCTASLAYSVLASKVEEDTVREDEAALTLLASDSPEPGAATRLPLGQATALALAYAEQQIRRDTGRRKAKRKCGPGSFCDSPGGEVACIEEASDGSLAWVRA